MTTSDAWYIVKRDDGYCDIISGSAPKDPPSAQSSSEEELKRWGPFASEGEAIARRVGLIRARKCQPF